MENEMKIYDMITHELLSSIKIKCRCTKSQVCKYLLAIRRVFTGFSDICEEANLYNEKWLKSH